MSLNLTFLAIFENILTISSDNLLNILTNFLFLSIFSLTSPQFSFPHGISHFLHNQLLLNHINTYRLMTALTVSLEFLTKVINGHNFQASTRPLIIGISGPQGSGKSFLTLGLLASLQSKYPQLNIVQFLMDDLYLSHHYQDKVTQQARLEDNPLLQGRGLPGTHDVVLGREIFSQLQGPARENVEGQPPGKQWGQELNRGELNQELNQELTHGSLTETQNVQPRNTPGLKIPIYDKSAFGGEGDRVPPAKWQSILSPVDLVIFEGWFNGFRPLDADQFRTKYLVSGPDGPLQRYRFSSLEAINNKLQHYTEFWNVFDKFVFLQTTSIDNVYAWRLEQEHDLVTKEGRGMDDDQVKDFVRRYMPVYHLYYEKMCSEGVVEEENGNLRIEIDKARNVVGTSIF